MNAATTEHFLELLRQFDVGMFATQTPQGELHVRPMAVGTVDTDSTIWLLTSVASVKVEEIQLSPRCALSFQDDPTKYLVVTGSAELVRNAQLILEVWDESYRAWFPGGPEDPTLVLIRVDSELGEYWDNSGIGRARYAYEFARAYVTGSRPRLQGGADHGTVELSD